jgi:hypothetical protein
MQRHTSISGVKCGCWMALVLLACANIAAGQSGCEDIRVSVTKSQELQYESLDYCEAEVNVSEVQAEMCDEASNEVDSECSSACETQITYDQRACVLGNVDGGDPKPGGGTCELVYQLGIYVADVTCTVRATCQCEHPCAGGGCPTGPDDPNPDGGVPGGVP